MLNSGIVDQDVNSSEPLDRIGYHCRYLSKIGQVAFIVKDIYIVTFAEVSAKRFNFFAVAKTIEHYFTALFGEGGRDRVSDARSCTRYDG